MKFRRKIIEKIKHWYWRNIRCDHRWKLKDRAEFEDFTLYGGTKEDLSTMRDFSSPEEMTVSPREYSYTKVEETYVCTRCGEERFFESVGDIQELIGDERILYL